MSWNYSATNVEKGDLDTVLRDKHELYFEQWGHQHALVESRQQSTAAIHAAVEIAATVGLGNVNVTLSGHANAGHGEVPGYSNDMVNISVYAAPLAQEKAAAVA